ncbi:MAG TPA: S41 family peptidase [Polyangia bacterium]|nr:S41 family peptidase [Polyangia bacterium]
MRERTLLPSPLGRATRLALVFSALTACATTPPPPAAEPVQPAPDARLQPPPFAGGPAPTADARQDQRTTQRRAIVEAVWRTVREKHFDPTLGGVDWDAVRRRYEPMALAAPDDAAFYRTLNDMVGELGQSHMMVTGPGASDDDGAEPAATGTESDKPSEVGDPGLIVRAIDHKLVITAVRPNSSAAKHHLAPGFVVTAIGGRPAEAVAAQRRSLRPVEERFAIRRAILHRLQGPAGTKVTLDYLDNADKPGQVILERDPPAGPARQIGYLPPLHPEAHITETNGVGVIAFNVFLLDPLMDEIKRGVDRFVAHNAKGVILDLRGNPGGLGAMAIPVASEFVSAPTTLGSMVMRDATRTDAVTTFAQTFVAQPSLGRKPFLGPLVILTDEGTASASEILAAGLQEAGRARVIGDSSLGAVLPSVVAQLPHGAVMQVVVADFKTPKGILLEGRGVQPDQRVLETRAAFRDGHDPVMEAALAAIATRGPNRSPPRAAGSSTDAKGKAKTPAPVHAP